MNLRRLLASMRGRRERAKTPKTTQIDPSRELTGGDDVSGARVQLILEDGDTVPLKDDERLEYLAENLLRAHERRDD